MNPNKSTTTTALVFGFAVLMLVFSSVGCASESIARNVDFTHWHDEETVILVYKRSPSTGGFNTFFRPEPVTTHVLICQIQEDNAVQCKDQRQIANLLNPHAVDSTELADRWVP